MLLLFSNSAFAQPGPNDDPQLSVPLTISDGTTTNVVHFGLDVRATTGYDATPGLLEDENPPPIPPQMDARFFLDGGAESKRDYRFGDGRDQSETHILIIREATGTDANNQMTISWDLPTYLSGAIRNNSSDAFIAAMSGNGSVTVETDAILGSIALKLEMTYTDITPGILPVELTSFTALVQGTQAVLNWETASETNNAGFEVQQLVNGSYQSIGYVTGNGTTTEAQHYSFTTNDLAAGSHDFRLKQVDFDGTFAYSPVVTATVSLAGAAEMQKPYPDPFNPQTQFNMTIAREQNVNIEVYDMLGRQIKTLYSGVLAPNESHLFTFEASNLPSGRYFIRAVGEFFTQSQTVTLLK